ncbi:MAG: murein hydrolase activator EnvC family protein [Flavobacteriales bacterium]
MISFKTVRKISTKRLIWLGFSIVMAAALCLPFSHSFAQNKKGLEKQRDDLNSQIELTKKLIKESEKSQKTTTTQLQMLTEQLAYREQLLQNITDEIGSIDSEINHKTSDIEYMRTEVENMKDEYAHMIRNAYIHRNAHSKLMFLFSAQNFNQAYKRFKYTQRYAEARMQQVKHINETQAEITTTIADLQNSKQQKEALAQNKSQEKNEIEADKKEQKKKLESLKTEEDALRTQQKQQKADRDKLTAKIQEIIAEEIKKEEEKQREAARVKAAKDKTTTPAAGKTTTKTMELAPETKLANTDFENNKGVLPWPVGAGVITSHFGKHAHPTLDQVTVNNNGVDFNTESEAQVLAVFNGTVSSVFSIAGAGQNVIITHGSYKTVYSGLQSVTVKAGDKVTTKQKIGTVMNSGGEFTLHFEVWKVGSETGTAQNPESWLKKK